MGNMTIAASGFHLGPIRLANRMLMAPFKTATAEPGGAVSQRTVDFYTRLAEGGVAMVTTEPMAVLPSGREHPRQLAVHDDRYLDGLARIVEAAHNRAIPVCCHLNHAGRAANPKASGGPPPAPSEFGCPTTGQDARALDQAQIREILNAYRQAARRARQCGYDAVELQMGHGYLVSQFLSPRTNRRTDDYGGSEKGRLLFARQVMEAVSEGTGGRIPILVRVSGSEMTEGGLDADDLAGLLQLVEGMGAAAVHVGMGSACDTPAWYYAHMALPMNPQEEALARIREKTRLPLVAAGRMGEPERMERVLAGPADLVALARPLVADPDLPRKVVKGRISEITFCGSCLQGCLARVKQGQPIACIVNPTAGRPDRPAPASSLRRILVAGGGPAGMTAAMTLAARGHRVSLYEREPRLGGQFALASRAAGKERMDLPFRSMIHRLERSGVEVHVGTKVTPEMVKRLQPDAVIVATGAEPVRIPIPGLDTVRVTTGTDVFAHDPEVGSRVLVLGGGMIGMEAAEHLARRGAEVVVVEMLDEIARDMEPVTRKMLLSRLQDLPVTLLTATVLERVGPEGATVRSKDGTTQVLPPPDTVVLAVGTRPVRDLADDLRQGGTEVHVVGDADEPRQVIGAVEGAWALAASL